MNHYTTQKLTPELFDEWVKTRKGELTHDKYGIVQDYINVPWLNMPHNFLFESTASCIFYDSDLWKYFTLRLEALEQKEEKSFSDWFDKEGVILYRGQANIIEAMRASWNAARGK